MQREVQNFSFHCLSPICIPAAGNTELSCCPGLTIAGFSQLFVASLHITFSFLLPLVLWVGQNKMAEILAVRVGQGDEEMGFFTIRNCPVGVFIINRPDTSGVRRNQIQDQPQSGSKRNDTSVPQRRTNSFSKLFPVLCLVERREASTLSTLLLEICLKVLFYCNFLKIKPVIIISYAQSIAVCCVSGWEQGEGSQHTPQGLGKHQLLSSPGKSSKHCEAPG